MVGNEEKGFALLLRFLSQNLTFVKLFRSNEKFRSCANFGTLRYYNDIVDDVDQKPTAHKESVGRKRQRRCLDPPDYSTPSPSMDLPLPLGEFEPTQKCYNEVVDDVIRKPQLIRSLSEEGVRDDVLILLTTQHHRLARFFQRLLSVARQTSQYSAASIIAAELVELLINLLPDLHQLLETANVLRFRCTSHTAKCQIHGCQRNSVEVGRALLIYFLTSINFLKPLMPNPWLSVK